MGIRMDRERGWKGGKVRARVKEIGRKGEESWIQMLRVCRVMLGTVVKGLEIGKEKTCKKKKKEKRD